MKFAWLDQDGNLYLGLPNEWWDTDGKIYVGIPGKPELKVRALYALRELVIDPASVRKQYV